MASIKRALLINPWIVDFAAYDFWLRPLGLMWLGAFLTEAGFDVNMIDCLDRTHPSIRKLKLKRRSDGSGSFLKTEISAPEILDFVPRRYGRYGIEIEVFREELESIKVPDIIFVTCSMTYWYPGAFEAIEILKERFPGVTVVLGGRYSTLCTGHAEMNSNADIVLPGPIGAGFERVVKDIVGSIIKIPESFSDWNMPAHGLHPDRETAAIMISSGCPYRCTYCVSSILNEKYETRCAQDVISEIRDLVEERGVRHIAIYDDALLADRNNVLTNVLDFVIEKNYQTNFYTPNALHARFINRDIAEKMKIAGFSHLRIGYESADVRFQNETGGKVTDKHFENAVECLASAGFNIKEIGAYMIFGHPDQDAAGIEKSINRVAKLGVSPVLAEYSPIPGSKDFEKAMKLFRRPPDADPLLHNSSIVMYQHPNMSREDMESLKRKCRNIRDMIPDGKGRS